MYEEGEEPCEESPEDELMKVEWPTGVPQASDKDLAKLSYKQGVGRHSLPAAIILPSSLPSLFPHTLLLT